MEMRPTGGGPFMAADGPRILSFSLTLRIPAWAVLPTMASYRDMYAALQSQLDLNRLDTPGTPPACVMAKGNALQIRIQPDQGLFQCVRNLEAVDGGDKPHAVEDMTQEFLVALSEARKHLRPVLFVSPAVQLRALWDISDGDANAFLHSRLGVGVKPQSLDGNGWLLGLHAIRQTPPQPGGIDLSAADLRVEPFVRAPSSVWIESTFQYPAVAIPGIGVSVHGSSGETVHSDDVSKVFECSEKARELLIRVPAFLGQEGA